eukprot:TRINITY_DN570_c0_g4_i1.p1 TRINITY_DN570_c0_g4~~TRINITY_DN570_c0_g4_i1.p1  ORF type:complete len:542 (-),score=106.51 TRINITY_DN570_c0_g4_i1:114-1739(-)
MSTPLADVSNTARDRPVREKKVNKRLLSPEEKQSKSRKALATVDSVAGDVSERVPSLDKKGLTITLMKNEMKKDKLSVGNMRLQELQELYAEWIGAKADDGITPTEDLPASLVQAREKALAKDSKDGKSKAKKAKELASRIRNQENAAEFSKTIEENKAAEDEIDPSNVNFDDEGCPPTQVVSSTGKDFEESETTATSEKNDASVSASTSVASKSAPIKPAVTLSEPAVATSNGPAVTALNKSVVPPSTKSASSAPKKSAFSTLAPNKSAIAAPVPKKSAVGASVPSKSPIYLSTSLHGYGSNNKPTNKQPRSLTLPAAFHRTDRVQNYGFLPSDQRTLQTYATSTPTVPPQTYAPAAPPQTYAPVAPPQTYVPVAPPQTHVPVAPPQTHPSQTYATLAPAVPPQAPEGNNEYGCIDLRRARLAEQLYLRRNQHVTDFEYEMLKFTMGSAQQVLGADKFTPKAFMEILWEFEEIGAFTKDEMKGETAKWWARFFNVLIPGNNFERSALLTTVQIWGQNARADARRRIQRTPSTEALASRSE